MSNKKHVPLYQNIINDIRAKIINCTYLPGDKIDSLTEICKKYNVSKITASSVIDRLAETGILKKVQGKGTFVSSSSPVSEKPLNHSEIKKIILISSQKPGAGKCTGDMDVTISRGIMERASELSMNIEFKYISFNDLNNEILVNPLHDIKQDEGVIVYYANNNIFMNSIFYGMSVRGVVIDGIFPGAFSAVTDNNTGMAELVEYLHELGHRNLIMCYRFSGPSCFFNVNERCDAFLRETKRLGMKGQIFEGSTFQEIITLMKSRNKPSAILFPQDDPALSCINCLEEAGYNVPEDVNVCGFDDLSKTPEKLKKLTTVHVDFEKLGRAAVDMLLKENLLYPSREISLWKRIKPKLIKRGSTCFWNK
jgi:DNA-binding LacI/PurR family transcriptional regulator